MHEDLREACLEALKIDRREARAWAERFSWSAASGQFAAHLKPLPRASFSERKPGRVTSATRKPVRPSAATPARRAARGATMRARHDAGMASVEPFDDVAVSVAGTPVQHPHEPHVPHEPLGPDDPLAPLPFNPYKGNRGRDTRVACAEKFPRGLPRGDPRRKRVPSGADARGDPGAVRPDRAGVEPVARVLLLGSVLLVLIVELLNSSVEAAHRPDFARTSRTVAGARRISAAPPWMVALFMCLMTWVLLAGPPVVNWIRLHL